MPIRWRLTADGSLLAPRRGRPPVCPDGYYVDEGDVFRCLPILIECDLREMYLSKERCCLGLERMRCNYNGKTIAMIECTKCKACPEEYWNEQGT